MALRPLKKFRLEAQASDDAGTLESLS
uniref:Uncharacterized protein n=1 Tax=Melanopsichium pennsylvanicum 4 TaxID=1398559 RepID=A0A077R8X7_9BASI|nr:uncharacterized protein BN887_06328 [Melanopsichium pennsylvanicum 4]